MKRNIDFKLRVYTFIACSNELSMSPTSAFKTIAVTGWILENITLYRSIGKFSRRQIDDIFLFSPENRIWHFMEIVSTGDSFHEMSKPVFWGKQENISIWRLLKILPRVLSVAIHLQIKRQAREGLFWVCDQRRPRSAYAAVQSH